MRQRVQRLLESGVMQIVAVTDPLIAGVPAPGDGRHQGRGRRARPWPTIARRSPRSSTSCSPPARSTSWSRSSCEDDDDLLAPAQRQDPHASPACARPRRSSTSASASRPTSGAPDEHLRPAVPTSSTSRSSAPRHLWMHFSRLGAVRRPASMPIIDRGEGCYAVGPRTASATSTRCPACSSCRSATAARSWPTAARQQAEQLAYFPIWSYAHPPAIELAARLAELAPGDLNRVFFTTGGSEAVESAWKLARQYFRAHRPARPLQGHRPRRPRTTARRWARSRSPACPRMRDAVRAAHARRASTCRTPTAYRPWLAGRRRREDFGRSPPTAIERRAS